MRLLYDHMKYRPLILRKQVRYSQGSIFRCLGQSGFPQGLLTLVYRGANEGPKIWVHQNCISEFKCMMPFSYPKIWVPDLLKPGCHQHLLRKVPCKLRNDFQPN